MDRGTRDLAFVFLTRLQQRGGRNDVVVFGHWAAVIGAERLLSHRPAARGEKAHDQKSSTYTAYRGCSGSRGAHVARAGPYCDGIAASASGVGWGGVRHS